MWFIPSFHCFLVCEVNRHKNRTPGLPPGPVWPPVHYMLTTIAALHTLQNFGSSLQPVLSHLIQRFWKHAKINTRDLSFLRKSQKEHTVSTEQKAFKILYYQAGKLRFHLWLILSGILKHSSVRRSISLTYTHPSTHPHTTSNVNTAWGRKKTHKDWSAWMSSSASRR